MLRLPDTKFLPMAVLAAGLLHSLPAAADQGMAPPSDHPAATPTPDSAGQPTPDPQSLSNKLSKTDGTIQPPPVKDGTIVKTPPRTNDPMTVVPPPKDGAKDDQPIPK